MTISNVQKKIRRQPPAIQGVAVIDALEDRLSFCSNRACQNGSHNLRVIFNFGFFVRGFQIHQGRAMAATRRRTVAADGGRGCKARCISP